jgi:hypothetical protein
VHQNRPRALPKNLAPANVNDSFQVKADKDLLGIKESELGKLFLLRSSLTTKIPAPQFQGMQSRLIIFKKVKDRIVMFESNKGQVTGSNSADDIPLDTFSFEKDANGFLWFKFADGSVLTSENWNTSDFGSKEPVYSQAGKTLNSSFVDKLVIQNNSVVIHQKGFLPFKGHSEIRSFIDPYKPDPNYKPLYGSDFKNFGFFEVSPIMLEDGSASILATRFNPEKKLQWYISSNTPVEFYDAVRDGILYWNKALGREWIEVVKNTDKDLSAPNPTKNIVQWVNWDTAGFAYADVQSDPLTGENLNAQIFMSSAFSFGSKNSLRRRMRLSTEQKDVLTKFHGACDHGVDKFKQDLSRAVHNLKLSDEDILRISQDFVRNIVAHEVGHTLGLRHNFAGNLAANKSPSELDEMFGKYLRNEATPEKGTVVTSTVMDYEGYTARALSGWQIGHVNFNEEDALPYDRKAVQFLTLNQASPKIPDNLPLFCTDSQVLRVQDCLRFDRGRNLYEGLVSYKKALQRDLKFDALEIFYEHAFPALQGERPIKPRDLVVDISQLSDSLTNWLGTAYLLSFTENRNFMKTRGNEMSIANGSVLSNLEQERNEKFAFDSITSAGGLANLWWKVDPGSLTEYLKDYDALIDNYLADIPFDAADKEYIKAKAPELIKEYFKYHQEEYLRAFSEINDHFLESESSYQLEDDTETYFGSIILGPGAFSEKARILAAKNLRKGRGIAVGWGRTNLPKLIEQLQKQNVDYLAADLSPRAKSKKIEANNALVEILQDVNTGRL